jgi:hypothetical protein
MSDRILHRLLDLELQIRMIDAQLEIRGEARPSSRSGLLSHRAGLVNEIDRLERMLGDGRTSARFDGLRA